MNTDLILRLMVMLVLAASFLISGINRKRARDESGTIERQEEGTTILILRMAATIPLAAVMLLNLFLPEIMTWSKITLPLWLRLFGAALSIVCVLLLWWVFRSIGSNISETILTKESHELVTSGPYATVRHPLYGTALLLLFSISLMLEDWFIFFYSLAGLVVFRLLVIPAEEKQLLEAFGEEYEGYQAKTGAIFPWFR